MDQKDAFSHFDKIAKSYSKKDKIALIHDLDADGISAAVIVMHSLEIFRGKGPDLVVTQRYKTVEILPETIGAISAAGISKVIIVDMASEQVFDSLKKLESVVGHVLILDHHKRYTYPSSKGVLILKSQDVSGIDPSRYPASKLVFDLFSRLVNLSQFSWIAAIGVLGDNQLKQWETFVQSVVEEHSVSLHELKKCMHIISAVEVLAPQRLNELLMFIFSLKEPADFLSSEFSNYLNSLESEILSTIEKFNSQKEFFNDLDLVWFNFFSKNNLKSVVINRISNDFYPDKTVIVVQDKGDDYLYISARRQDFKVKVNDLLEAAVKGFDGAGAGGHIPAAAGRIKKQDFTEFKKRVLEQLKK